MFERWIKAQFGEEIAPVSNIGCLVGLRLEGSVLYAHRDL